MAPRGRAAAAALGALSLGSLAASSYAGAPPRPAWADKVDTVHLIFSNHLDIGFDGIDPEVGYDFNVVNKYFDVYFPRALATAEHFRDLGGSERFVWTTHSYLVSLYLDCPVGMGFHCPDAAAQAALREGIAAGDVTWHAFPHNAQVEFMDPHMLAAGFQLTHDLDRRLGLPPKQTMSQRDVPGLTRTALPVLNDNGVSVLSVGVNGFSAPPDVPRPGAFVWADPESGASVLAFWHAGGYGGQQDGPDPRLQVGFAGDCVVTDGLNHALCFAWKADNAGPHEPAEVLQDYAVMRREFPNAVDIRASTFDAFAQVLITAQPYLELPAITDEIGDSWIIGVASDPVKTMHFRAIQRARSRCLDAGACDITEPNFANFTRLMLKVPEHTWGNDIKKSLAEYDPESWTNAKFRAALASGKENYARTVEAWRRQRAYLKWAVEALPPADPTGLRSAIAEEVAALKPAPDVVPTGFNTLTIEQVQGDLLLGEFTLRLGTQNFGLEGFAGAGTQWANPERPLFQPVYSTYTEDDYSEVWENYAYDLEGAKTWGVKDFGKPGSAAATEHRELLASFVQASAKQDPDGNLLAIYVEGSFPKAVTADAGAPSSVSLLIEAAEDGVLYATFTWRRKQPTRLPEAFWLRNYGPVGGDWRMHKMYSSVYQPEVLANGSALHAVADAGVTADFESQQLHIGSLDAPLVAAGEPSPFYALQPQSRERGKAAGVSFCLSNNIWGTNYVMWNPMHPTEADLAFRFTLATEASGRE